MAREAITPFSAAVIEEAGLFRVVVETEFVPLIHRMTFADPAAASRLAADVNARGDIDPQCWEADEFAPLAAF